MKNLSEQLGEPDLKIGGFQLWIHSREREDSVDYYDGNWLNVTAHCGGSGADVWTSGNFILLQEIEMLQSGLVPLYETLQGKMSLECMEPELRIAVETGPLGHAEVEVQLTPDHLSQQHSFRFEVDQSDIGQLIKQCKKALVDRPIRGRND